VFSEFSEPDWNAPIDFQARLAAIPASAVTRGMFFQLLLDALGPGGSAGLAARRYVAFKNYPMYEYVELMQRYCERTPHIPATECVRRLGRGVYPSYAATLTGTAIFAIAGRNFRRVVEQTPAAYKVAAHPASVTIRSVSDGHAVVELRDLWNLPDLHQVGIWEGAMDVCGAQGRIAVHARGFGSADFEISWSQS
jgi:uncharacterized protein (TIGR02265 family)